MRGTGARSKNPKPSGARLVRTSRAIVASRAPHSCSARGPNIPRTPSDSPLDPSKPAGDDEHRTCDEPTSSRARLVRTSRAIVASQAPHSCSARGPNIPRTPSDSPLDPSKPAGDDEHRTRDEPTSSRPRLLRTSRAIVASQAPHSGSARGPDSARPGRIYPIAALHAMTACARARTAAMAQIALPDGGQAHPPLQPTSQPHRIAGPDRCRPVSWRQSPTVGIRNRHKCFRLPDFRACAIISWIGTSIERMLRSRVLFM